MTKKITEREVKKRIFEVCERLEGWKVVDYKIKKSFLFFEMIDNEGYRYSDVNYFSVKQGKTPISFAKNNSFTEFNINHFLKKERLSYRLIAGQKYGRMDENLRFECLQCGYKFLRNISNIKKRKTGCSYCNDKISYPNRLGRALFEEIGAKYIPEYGIKDRRYDFYLPEKNIIVEFHGVQHYERSFFGSYTGRNRSLEEEKENDFYKKEIAKRSGIKHYITIDSRVSEIDYLSDKIMRSKLSDVFDLSEVNWDECEKLTSSNLLKDACTIWNAGSKNISEISTDLKISDSTVRRYLKKGAKFGWCDYNASEIQIENAKRMSKITSKKVVQLSHKGDFVSEFDSVSSASRQLGIKSTGDISKVCKNKYGYKSAGGYRWMYKEDYDKMIADKKNKSALAILNKINYKVII